MGLAVEIVDAYLKLGAVRRARAVLRRLPDGREVHKRRRVLRWLSEPADPAPLLESALARHPLGDRVRRQLAQSAGDPRQAPRKARERAVRALAEADPDEATFRLLGLLLYPTPHRRLTLLFLTASQQLRRAPLAGIERLRVRLLYELELYEVALQRALRLPLPTTP
jgi:hypothetical protein